MRRLALAAAIGALGLGVGCNGLIDQSELTRERSDRLVVPILSTIDPVDEGENEFSGASDVKPNDLKVITADYVIGANDLVTISVFDLINNGVESVRTARVSQTGMISLPMQNEPIKAAGLTENQLQKSIAARYRDAGLIQNAQVTVTTVEARQRTFNIAGSVQRTGQYAIVEADFRLLNALIQGGEMTYQPQYLYVIRKISSETPATQPAPDTQPMPLKGADPAVDPLAPKPDPLAPPKIDPLAPKSEGPAFSSPLLAMQEAAARAGADAPKPDAPPTGAEEKFILIDGKPVAIGGGPAVPATQAAAPTTQPSPVPQPAYEFGAALKADEEQRVIRVPITPLKNGDLRYNIIIRPNDMIVIPGPIVGEYYMGGHVGGVGVFSLTGRKITLKQAIISAHMVDALAVPQKTDIIRRIGQDKEIFVRVNLAKIWNGSQPDVFLKPNDVVTVGTDWYPPFLAAVRGAFRFTYGFGFLYDRNFAPQQKQQTGN